MSKIFSSISIKCFCVGNRNITVTPQGMIRFENVIGNKKEFEKKLIQSSKDKAKRYIFTRKSQVERPL